MPRCSNIITNNFSRYAKHYDTYADIQAAAAQELIARTPASPVRSILDIGCGTGEYTSCLRQKYKDAAITAIDLSSEMIEVARHKCGEAGIEYIRADAENFHPRLKFDLITSNATFQWFGDIDRVLCRYRDYLHETGMIVYATFGPRTFYELAASIKDIFGEGSDISAGAFPDDKTIFAAMEKYFRDPEIDEQVVVKRYGSVLELLTEIKYTGTRGWGIAGSSGWQRGMLDKIEKVYRGRSGTIEATYQIFYCRARL